MTSFLKIILNKFVLVAVLLLSYSMSFSQSKKKEMDIAAIKSMEGCYNVVFKYTETFAPEVDYEKAYDYTSAGLEWAEIIEETDNKIVLQHILIVNDTTVIKHWRQDWTYEKQDRYDYDKDNRWTYERKDKKDIKGQWTQEVYQVDDSPRYSGSATWTHVDGLSSWFDRANSPLPRREYSKRNDYNVMVRGNRLKIVGENWVHEQDNDKVIRKDGKEDVLLVQEKGFNTYTKRPNVDCKIGKDWWENNKEKWAIVRNVWEEIYNNHEAIVLNEKVDEKWLYQYLFDGENYTQAEDIKSIIEKYVAH